MIYPTDDLYISYIYCTFVSKNLIMELAVKTSRRKVIDIPEDIFRYLSIKAVAQGTNLKRYIENLLAKDVEDMVAAMNDNEAYAWLLKNEPDGLIAVSEKEQEEFEQKLGIKRS